MQYLLLTFDSVNYTMKTEKSLKEKGYEIKTIPTPREVSTSCGLAIRLSMDKLDEMRRLKKEGLPIGYFWAYTIGDKNTAQRLEDEA